jgi:hypothetical protein
MRFLSRSGCGIVDDRSSLYSVLILKALICASQSHKRPVVVSSTRSGASSSWASMTCRIARSTSDGLRYCWRSSVERVKHVAKVLSNAYLVSECRVHRPIWRASFGRPGSPHHSVVHQEALRTSNCIQEMTKSRVR